MNKYIKVLFKRESIQNQYIQYKINILKSLQTER